MPYRSSVHAMSYWPEKETAVGVRLDRAGNVLVESAFGLDSLFSGHITYNNKRTPEVFQTRVESKGWLDRWPNLIICGV